MPAARRTDPLEKTALTLGFVPLTDCAPLAVGVEKGFFAAQGLEVTLSREPSWSNIRDKLMVGLLDGAHALIGLLLAMTAGVGTFPTPTRTAHALGLNGNAITVSLPLLTPSGNVQVQGLAPGAALRPAPVVTPFLSAIQGPGAPPAAPPQPAARTEPVPPPSAPPMAAPEKPAPEKPSTSPRTATATVVTTAGVRLRAAPKVGARVLDTVERGETLEAFGPPADGWVRVGRGGRPLGYIAADHLAETGAGKADHRASGRYAKAAPEDRGCALPDDLPAETRRPLLPAGTVARVLADANLRVAPACDAKVEDVLERGERVTVQDSTGSWYRVGREGRSLGYVGAALLVPVKGR